MKKIILIAFYCLVAVELLHAQDADLLDSLEHKSIQKEYVTNAFKSSRVINGHSMELIGKGVLDFRILHRFGRISGGGSELFGLDQASMRIGLDYGLGTNLTVGVGRTTFKKDVDAFVKWRPIRQVKQGVPISWVLVAGTSLYTYKNPDPQKQLNFSSRIGYYYQSIIGRKFNPKFSLQISPTMVHRNMVDVGDVNDIYAIGVGARYKFSPRSAFVIDYFPVLNHSSNSTMRNSLSVGFDIETGGHVFQLHFSNTTGMNERAFITDTHDSWQKGQMRFGFNLSRVFSVKKVKSVSKEY
jgi:hypothetical protein